MKHILSFSGGKDSTYLENYLVENSYPLDEAVMFDTGWEFPQMYKHIEKMRAYLENHGVKLTVLKPKRSFDYLMTEKLVKERNDGGCHYGYSKEQDRILMQTAYKVTDDKNAFNHLQYNHSGRACRTRLRVRCPAAQKAEVEFLFSFYVRLWEKEKEALLQAFFQKHRIFGNLKDGESGAELSPEELLKLELMMKGLSDEQPLKQLTDGAGGVQ